MVFLSLIKQVSGGRQNLINVVASEFAIVWHEQVLFQPLKDFGSHQQDTGWQIVEHFFLPIRGIVFGPAAAHHEATAALENIE
jgi:hypothetical protein